MQIEDKISQIKNQFDINADWEKKYEKIIELGKQWPGMTAAEKVDDLKVKGCQSQVWMKAELTPDKKIIFKGDSDAILVKGLVALALTIYSNETPETILKTEPTFLKDIGFDSGLSPSRSNGLYSMIKQIKYYATAFQYLLSK
ncbi:MAG: SufE family protein [Bdellovibrio sp.]|nr:SufE family protein [Bdellovibrio sp.]